MKLHASRKSLFACPALFTLGLLGIHSFTHAGPLYEPPVIDAQNTAQIELTASRQDGYVIDGFNGIVDGLMLYSTPQQAPSLAPAVWATQPGSSLKVELTNQLPCTQAPNDAGVMEDIEHSDFTNLHVHGLMVSPFGDGTWNGDNSHLLVSTFNTECARMAGTGMMPDAMGKIRYRVNLPPDHHYGLSWFHPHVHGVAGLQVSGGMSGLIAIGDVWKYAYAQYTEFKNKNIPTAEQMGRYLSRNQDEARFRSQVDVKHLMFKDMQLAQTAAADATNPARYQYSPRFDPGFCGANDLVEGSCDGADNSKWLFTVNGSVFPTIAVGNGRRHVWRMGNVGATVSYQLQLRVTNMPNLPAAKAVIPLQVLVHDGAAVAQNRGAPEWQSQLTLMPSARMEVHVDPLHVCRWLDLNNIGIKDKQHEQCTMPQIEAVLETIGPVTYADVWPKGALAKVVFAAIPRYSEAFDAGPMGIAATRGSLPLGYAPPFLDTAPACANPSTITSAQYRLIGLKNGGDPEIFGMVTEGPFDLNEAGFPRATSQPYQPYDMMRTDLCIGADISQKYSEIWVLRNEAQEIHNFHVHQMKFEMMAVNGVAAPLDRNGQFPLHDNYPIGVGEWVQIRVTFDHPEQAGRFMYHCHILEHEDKGMMSNIQVVDTSRGLPLAQRLMMKSKGRKGTSTTGTQFVKQGKDAALAMMNATMKSSVSASASLSAQERLAQYRASVPAWMAGSVCTPKTTTQTVMNKMNIQ